MIYVCNMRELEEHAVSLAPDRLISVVGAAYQPPTPLGLDPGAHLRVSCDDIVEPAPLEVAPDRRHIEQIIAFARDWDPAGKILVHCYAGISRSTAAALIVYCAHFPETVGRATGHLRRTASYARPNALIVALGDELLGMNGRLVEAVRSMGPASFAMEGRLVGIPHPALPEDDTSEPPGREPDGTGMAAARGEPPRAQSKASSGPER